MDSPTILILIVKIIISVTIAWSIRYTSEKYIRYKTRKNTKLEIKPYKVTSICTSILTALICVYALSEFSLAHAILLILFTYISAVMTCVDNSLRIIGNESVLAMFIVSVIYSLYMNGITGLGNSLITSVGTGLFFVLTYTLMKHLPIVIFPAGAGDFKLVLVIAFALGYPQILTALFVTMVVLLIWICVGLLAKKLTLTSTLPMAGFIALGFMVTVLELGADTWLLSMF